jgi:hypothetical protein
MLGLRVSAPAVGMCCSGHRPGRQPFPACILFATPDLLLKHLDATVATYKTRQMKQLKHASKTLAKTPEKYLKTIANICNIQIKRLK